jgi:hypothetical protein
MKYSIILVFILFFYSCQKGPEYNVVLLSDNFSKLDTGLFSAPVGPLTEYHYLKEAGKKGNWEVSSFASGEGWGTAWRVITEDSKNVMRQTYLNKTTSTHPIIISGDSLWHNYKLTVRFRPDSDQQSAGVTFRYKNDRCFYFFGIKNSKVYISLFHHSDNSKTLNEKVLAEGDFSFTPGKYLTATVVAEGSQFEARLNDGTVLKATDSTFKNGKIGLLANARVSYKDVEVLTSKEEEMKFFARKDSCERESQSLQSDNTGMVVWKKIKTKGFGVGRNLRFGDMDGDKQIDVLIGQVIHHGPKDSHSELSCITAMTFDGRILWQKGIPDPGKDNLTNDVGFQIADIDNDGKNEVVYCMNFEIIVADGATGKTKYKAPTPKSKIENDKFNRILGDCLFFFDCEGKGFDSNILIKDRYNNFWVLNNKLKVIWEGSCKTGHYPYASDIDQDKKDELAIGYSLYDDNGKNLWCLDKELDDHADGVAIVNLNENNQSQPVIIYTASNAGFVMVSLSGTILKHYYIGHVQNPAIANFRSDMDGLETVSINFWGNQGIVHFYDSKVTVYHDFEPNQFGSMCLPLNWKGDGEEYFVHNPNIHEGGIFDGWGRKTMEFPDDRHPDMCNAVLDITGDCRDEIVVWNPDELWVYTQSDNPRKGRLYKPVRNKLYNYSNYQATVSIPGWNN